MDLGTIQYNVEANTTDIDKANAAVDNMAEHMDDAAQSTEKLGKKITETAAKSDASSREILNSFEKINSALKREIDLYGDTSRAAALRYDIERGALGSITSSQKQSLVALAETADQMDRAAASAAGLARAEEAAAAAARQANASLQQQFKSVEDSLLRELSLYGEVSRAAKLRYETEFGSLKNLSAAQKQSLGVMADQLDSLEKTTAKTSGAIGGFGRNAGQAGIQVQQFVGQIQGGQNVFVALSQQAADLGIVLGAPLVGVIVSLAAVAAGTLLPSLFNTGEQIKAVSDLTKELVKDFKDFSDAQKLVINKGVAVSLVAETDALSKKKKEVGELTRALNEQKKAYAALPSGGTGRGGYGARQAIEDTIKYKEANASLVKSQLEVVDIEKRIKELRDPTGSDKKTKSLSDEAAITGLVGRAYWELKAAQEGVADSRKEEYIAAGLSLDKKKEEIKTAKELDQEADRLEKKREAAAVKDLAAEKSRAENIQKMIASMKEEADLFGSISREAKTRYEIENGLIKAKTQAEKDALITQAKRIDQLNDEKALQESIDAEIEDREEESKKAQAKSDAELQKRAESISNMINDGLMRGFESGKGIVENFRDTVENVFKTLVLRPSVEIATAGLSKAVSGILGSVGKKDPATGITSGASGALGALGPYGAIAIAVGGSLISSWNAKQDAKFEKLESAYRQGVQSTGTVFGEANKKSESISNAITNLGDTAASTLDVNYEMRNALLAIQEGIAGVAAGFARTINTSGLTSGIKTGVSTNSNIGKELLPGLSIIGNALGGDIGGFVDGIVNSVSKAIYSKKTSIINSGIKIVGTNLADILESGTIQAFSFADVKTTKKVLGFTTSNKVKEKLEDLDSIFESQLAGVFINAGNALEEAGKVFGASFDASAFKIDTSKLSLKGLEGDALTKEIENFFSSTLDNWAGVLVGGTDVLTKFQQIGEGAFEAVVRLATQTNSFASYAEKLSINFNLAGLGAIEAVQNISTLSGGFDKLSSSLGSYYQNFFSDSERTAKGLSQIGDVLKTIGVDTVPATREAFRALIEDPSIDLATKSGQEYFSTLINLSGAFAQLIPATKELADAAEKAAAKQEAIRSTYYGLETRILELQGRTAELRQRELSTLDEFNRTYQEQIYALEDARKAEQEAVELQAEAERKSAELAAESAAKQSKIDSEFYSIETRLLQLYGDQTTLRIRELAALDESNRAYQRQIYDLEDAAKAAEEKAAADAKALEDQARAAEAAAKAMADLTQSLKDAASLSFNRLQSSITAEKDRISEIINNASSAKSAVDAAVNSEKDRLKNSLDQRIKAINDQANAEKTAQEAIKKARIDSLEDQKNEIENSVKGLQSLIGGISGAIDDMAIKSNALTAARRRAAEFEIETALRNARAGRLPTTESLGGALGALGGDQSAIFSSSVEMARANAITQNQLKAISDLAGTQLSSDEQMLASITSQIDIAKSTKEVITTKFDEQIALETESYDKQIASLDLISANAQSQFDLLTGIDTRALSLTDAIAKYNESLLAADFTNAALQVSKLDEINNNAKLQIDTLNGIDTSILSLNDSFVNFANAINEAAGGTQKDLLVKIQSLVDEVSALRSESAVYNESIAKNTGSTAASTKSLYKDGVTIIETIPS